MIASGSLMLSTILSNTRKRNTGSAVSCRNWTHTSVAMTSSIGAPPSATTKPLNPFNALTVDERSSELPPRNGIMRSCGKTSESLVRSLRDKKQPLAKNHRERAEVAPAL